MPGQTALTAQSANELGNSNTRYRVSYQLQTNSAEFTSRTVTNNNDANDAILTIGKAFEAAENIRQTIDNAINIKVQEKDIGNSTDTYGDVIFVDAFVANETDVQAWTEI